MLNPNFAESYYNRGILYKVIGNLEQSTIDYNKAIELEPAYKDFPY
ncbi:MAG: tetratricopeptide repeat protein [Blastocatellia bacterium]|nr:tetratricopeptide repeat protein [Blastocatellia bacterium]